MSDERRVAERFDLAKLIFVSKPEDTRGGLLLDISVTGAQVEFVAPLGTVHHRFEEGDEVNLVIDDLGEVAGTIVRALEKTVALRFRADDARQQELIAEVKIAFDAAMAEEGADA